MQEQRGLPGEVQHAEPQVRPDRDVGRSREALCHPGDYECECRVKYITGGHWPFFIHNGQPKISSSTHSNTYTNGQSEFIQT